MRRNGHPSRPRAITCCRFASLKTLLMPTEATTPHVGINVPDSYSWLAGFQVTLIGRFWLTPEGKADMKTRTLVDIDEIEGIELECRGCKAKVLYSLKTTGEKIAQRCPNPKCTVSVRANTRLTD